MQNNQISHFFVKSEGLDEMLDELRLDMIMAVLVCLIIAGFAMIFSAMLLPDMLQGGVTGLLLFALSLAVWFMRKRNFYVCAWTLVMGSWLIVWLLVLWTQIDAFLCLLIISAGLAFALLKLPGGVFLALISTATLIWLPAKYVYIHSSIQWIVIISVWLLLGIIWLAIQPLQTITTWSWASYKMNNELLEKVRSTNLQAQEALKDLSDANLQLTRLNNLAHSLRLAAEEARKTKEQFVANVSHELRTPLNMIIGFSEMIMQTPKEIYGSRISPKLLADLDVILRNSRHLSKLIDDVLDLSQVDAGQMALSKTLASMKEIIQTATTSVKPLFQSKGLYLNIDLPDEIPAILCDVTRIRQVVLNLLSNAGRFTEQGGVTVKVICDPRWMTISVTDTGPGIAADAKEQLFQPFHQMDSSLRSIYGGSGLGLSISKRFIEMHDGRIGFQSEESEGSTFYFQLPMTSPPVPAHNITRFINPYIHFEPRTRPLVIPKPTISQRFVILENGQALHRLLTRYVDQVEIDKVTSIQQAIEELEREPAQAFFINDVSMEDALKKLDETTAIPYGVPVIVCSIPGIENVTGMMGVRDYLVKPISSDALLTSLARLNLHHHRLLIADDEEDAFRLFRRMLLSSNENYTVMKAKNGEEALLIMRQQHPDVVLMDLAMPTMDGFQLLAEKGKDPSICDIPVIVISARDPTGQPIVSKSLAVSQSGGLSLPQVLACISAFSSILSKDGLHFDLKAPEDPSGLPASE